MSFRLNWNVVGRRLVSNASAAAVLLLLTALCRTGTAAPQNVYHRSQDFNLDARGVAGIVFASDVHTNLSVECWDQPQIRLTWTVDAVAAEGLGRSFPAGELEEFSGQRLKAVVEREGEYLRVRVTGDTARLKEERVVRGPSRPGGIVLRDGTTGLTWEVSLKVFVPRGVRLDTLKFKGGTNMQCGSPEREAAGTRRAGGLQLDQVSSATMRAWVWRVWCRWTCASPVPLAYPFRFSTKARDVSGAPELPPGRGASTAASSCRGRSACPPPQGTP